MIDRDIEARIRKVLLDLELLQGGRTVNFDPKTSSGKADSNAPPGFRDPFSVDRETGEARVYRGAPSKDTSLFAFYSYQFARARDDHRRRLLCFLAERDFHRHVKPIPGRKRAGSHLGGSVETTEERDDRILTMYQGTHALEAAVFEECSEAHIRKLRTSRRWPSGAPKYDATLGNPLPDEALGLAA